MKRVILFLVIIAAAAGWVFWNQSHNAQKPAGEAKAPEEEGTKITHDTDGNVVVHMPDEVQGEAGITVSRPAAASFNPEVKAYGRVMDPSPLLALMLELTSARIGFEFAHAELQRTQTLKEQNNASERALSAAAEASARNQAAMLTSLAKVAPVWGEEIFRRVSLATNLIETVRKEDPLLDSLMRRKSALVRVEIPAGQTLDVTDIQAARLLPLGEKPTPVLARFFDLAPTVDTQTQGRGLLFLIPENGSGLVPGAAVTAFIQTSGPPLAGVVLPSEAVVRAEGSAWVYVMGAGSDTFTRTEVTLDRPVERGWFVARSITASNYLVTTGAQMILSQETKPAGAPE